MKNRFVLLLVFLFFHMSGNYLCTRVERSSLRLIMIFNHEQKKHCGIDTLPAVLAVALLEQAAPILTTGAVLADFLTCKNDLDSKMVLCKAREKKTFMKALECLQYRSGMRRKILDAYVFGERDNDYRNLLRRWNHLEINKYVRELIEYYLWSQISLDSEHWYVARGVGDLSSLFLFIPRCLVDNNKNLKLSPDNLVTLGFNRHAFVPGDVNILCTTKSYVSEFSDDEKQWLIGDIRRCFNPQGGPWHIYLTGHGLPGLDQSQDSLVAGLTREQFRNLILYLHNNMVTRFLYYITCYGSGYNLIALFEDLLEGSKLNYSVATGTLTDLPADGFCFNHFLFPSRDAIVDAHYCSAYRDCAPDCPAVLQNVMAPLDFNRFFLLLDKIEKKSDINNQFDINDWKNILRSVMGGLNNSSSATLRTTPLLRTSGDDFFYALPIDERIMVLTYPFLHDCEKNGGVITVLNKRGILIYPMAVKIPVIIRGASLPAIISMNPEPALHYFSDLYLRQCTVEDFLAAMNNPQLRVACKKMFVIGHLVATSNEQKIVELRDVAIELDDKQIFVVGKLHDQFIKYCSTDDHLISMTAGEYYGALTTMLARLEEARAAMSCQERSLLLPASLWPVRYTDVQQFVCSKILFPPRGVCLDMMATLEGFCVGCDCKYRSFQYANSWYQKVM